MIDKSGNRGTFYPEYNLTAVVKLESVDCEKDYVRNYWKDGSEVKPAEIGAYHLKKPEAREKHWSV